MASIVARGVSKQFRLVSIPKQASLKELIVKGRFFRGAPRDERLLRAVDDVSFTVEDGASLGIIGRNGSGKTTLMRLIAGIYRPNGGTVTINGSAALLTLGLGFHPEMTGRENVKINGLVLGLSPKEVDERFDEIVDFAELHDFIDIPVRTYSSGMAARLMFAVAISINPDILLLDEILAVGDEAFSAKCLDRIRRFRDAGKTVVLVTHSPDTLKEWCDVSLWLERGRTRMFGPTAEVADAYRQDVADVPADLSLVL
jgi:ABC-2 type transport system ATP-binding protein/lipopolysaccharide transport system ATP-binding protein